jgi:plastocyanin/uncharacterized protein (DUF2141 family)
MSMKFSPKKYFATVLTAFLLCLIRPLSGLGAIVNVSVANNSFAPATANINAGDKVIWTWAPNSFSHNVVSESTPSAWVFPNNNALQSTPFAFTNTFNSAGSFPYECTLHVSSGMVGTINVAAAANQPPIVTITNPTSGTVFIAPANVTVQASASDSNGTVTNVQFRIGSTVLTNKAAAPFSAVTNNLPAGSYTLSAIASDNLGAKTTNSVNIIVDAPPSVTITNPASGAVFTAPANVTVQASASDSDGTVTNVQFLIGSTVLTNKVTAPFSAVTNNLPAGNYTLSAIASDNLGAKTTNSMSIIVDAPPSITITNPAPGTVLSAPANVTIKASASDTDGTVTNVQFLVGSIVLTNTAAVPFSAVTNNLAAGNYTLSAIASDNNGVKSTNAVAISVVTPLPLAINAPQLSSASFQFSFAANIGLSYVVQWSTNLTSPNWIPIFTSTAASNPVVFVDNHATNSPGFYRVGRLPNP